MAHINKRNIIIVVLLCLIFSGCDKSIKTFKLTIITTDKLGDKKTDKFSETIQQLCYPIKSECDKNYNYAFTPIVIKRLMPVNCELKLDIIADEKKSNIKSMNLRKNIVIKYFQDHPEIGVLLAEPNDITVDYSILLSNFLSERTKNIGKFFFAPEAEVDSILGAKIYSNADSLKIAISNFLCEFPETKNIYIILNPPNKNNSPVRGNGIQEKIRNLISEADKLFKDGRLRKAKQKYNEVLASDPTNSYAKKQIARIDNPPPPPPPPTPPQDPTGTIKFEYAKYIGNISNGYMNGKGTLVFYERHIIPILGGAERYANKGERVTGVWEKGLLVHGDRFDENNQQIETIYGGK